MRCQGGRWCPLAVLALLLLWAGAACAEVCKGSKVPKAELRRYDATAALSQREAETALATHLPWGRPSCPTLLPGREYILCYTTAHRTALWAAYTLRAEEVGTRARRDAFRSDPRLTADENAHCADYTGTGYARGHTVPDADMGRSNVAQANTYFLSNMSPQINNLNSGPWLWLERAVRDYAKQYGQVYVLSGSIFDAPAPTVPSRRMGIPARYYKVLVHTDTSGSPVALSLILPNQAEHFTVPPRRPEDDQPEVRVSNRLLEAHLVSIREIERLTGLDLLARLDRVALKEAVASALWPRN
jgi:DNA/RNA endonuclease G (NUC1)